jgi:flagellar protein FliJ
VGVKHFEFSLDRLLKVKQQLERLAEMEQQRAREAVDRARTHLEDLQNQLARVADQLNASVGRPMAPFQWTSVYDLADRLGRSIKSSEQELAETERKLRAAAQERAQVATEVEALVSLRQQQWAQWRQEVQKADQDRLDELGMRQWQAARGETMGGSQSPS